MRAVIVEINDNVAAILSEDGMISKIRNRDYAIGQEITIRNNNKYIKFAASAAAVLALLVTPAWAYLTPYSYVSLDINPSFEFSINRFDRVLEVRAANDDGEKIVENISIAELKNKEIKEAVKNVLVELKDQGYIIEGKEGGVVVATSSKNQEKTDKLAASLKIAVEKEVEFKAEKDDKVKQNEVSTETKTEKTEKTEKEEKEVQKEIKKVEEPATENEKAQTGTKEEPDKSKEIKDEAKEQVKENKEELKETKEASKEAVKEEKETVKLANKIAVEVIEVSQDEVDEAKKHNVTPGKLNLVKKLEEVYPESLNFDADEWLEKPVKEIMDAIKDYNKEDKESNNELKQEKPIKEEVQTQESESKSNNNKKSKN